MTNEERTGLVVQANTENMEEVGAPFNLDNVEYIIETPSNTQGPPAPLITPPRESQTLEEAFAALSNEHDIALESIKKLKTELSQARAKNLQLEDHIASGFKSKF